MSSRRLFLTQLSSGIVTATAGLVTAGVVAKDSEVIVPGDDLTTLVLTPEQETFLTIELNMYLRSRGLWDDHRKMVNDIFIQLGSPRHHESMVWAGLVESREIDGKHG